jgi:hypothetical protein
VEGSGNAGAGVRAKTKRTRVADDRPLVEARPVLQGGDLRAKSDGPAAKSAREASSASGKPEMQLSAPPVAPDQSAAVAALPPPDRTRQEFITRRDRLVRMAEGRMAEGESAEALEILEHATEVAGELAAHTTNDPQHVLELALLHRRTGTLAEGLSAPARAQTHYDSARRVLLELRAAGRLNKQGILTLADVESSLRNLQNQ